MLAGCGEDAPAGALRVDRVLGETGRHPGQFAYPRGLAAFDLDGRAVLAIVDKTARIQLIDSATGEPLGAIRTPKSDLGMPTGLTVAPDPDDPRRQALWVADTHEHRVLVYPLPFDTDGKPAEPAHAFGAYGDGPGQFIYPTDVAVIPDASGFPARVFVSEYGGNDRISEFRVRRDGGRTAFDFVRQIGTSGVAMGAPEDDPAALSRPQSIAVRDGRELVVTDVGRNRLVRFDLDTGRVVGWTGGAAMTDGSACDPLRFPYGVTLVGDRHAVVAEFGGSRLRLVELDTGATAAFIGGPGRGPGELATPWACEIVHGELVVLDSGNDRVQVARWNGPGGTR